MKATFFEVIAALAIATTLPACETLSQAHASEPEYARIARVHPGLTKDEVVAIAGRPGSEAPAARQGDVWIYTAPDEWGEQTEYDVTFDRSGIVTDSRALPDE